MFAAASRPLASGAAAGRLARPLYERCMASKATQAKLWPGLKRATELVMSTARGSEIYMQDGARYLDLSSGIGVVNTGHNHPRVVSAAAAQASKAVHLQMGVGYSEKTLELVERMEPHMPEGLDSFFFTNSGAEAVENALRLARHATGRDAIIAFQGGYHGRTAATLAVTTSSTPYRGTRSGPLPSGNYFAPYPYAHQGISEEFALRQLELLLKQQVQPQEVAAMIIEPVLGEGGYVPASPSFMRALRGLCDRHGMLLIADEVQSGYGRTGKMFAVEHSGVVPDILVVAKGIASGYPLSAVVSRHEITAKQAKGCAGGTYGGNAVACAAAIATLDIFEQEGVLENVSERSAQAFSALRALQAEGAPIGEVRGLGLMIGVEFDGACAGIAAKVAKNCLDRGMIVLTASVFETLRLIPTLTITEAEMAEAMQILRESILEAAEEYKPQVNGASLTDTTGAGARPHL